VQATARRKLFLLMRPTVCAGTGHSFGGAAEPELRAHFRDRRRAAGDVGRGEADPDFGALTWTEAAFPGRASVDLALDDQDVASEITVNYSGIQQRLSKA
jgi:hypothetical protein